jgi:UDP-N-acetyl-D-galactosamine dehydrogenase
MRDDLRKIAVIGLGYVGLPVALALAKKFPGTVGFDIDGAKVSRLRDGDDTTGEISREQLLESGLVFTTDPAALTGADFYVVAVPTPIDKANQPDLELLRRASKAVGGCLKKGDIVVYESTVYPGATVGICAPILEESSGLVRGRDFFVGYSPERINPGDKEHTFERVVKVVSGENAETLDVVAEVYGAVVDAGVHRAASIEVAEAAKVIENIQRDLNIALMNELSLIFDRLEIDTLDVLSVAGTKWNFLPFRPGLVGGHCIGVDPYYLTARAQQVGVNPEVILAGRRINDGTGRRVAHRCIKELVLSGVAVLGARVAVLGLAFKEDVRDLRNSRVPDIITELRDYGLEVLVHDPLADPREARHEYGLELSAPESLVDLSAVVLAVPHTGLCELAESLIRSGVPVVLDVKSALPREAIPEGTRLWRL